MKYAFMSFSCPDLDLPRMLSVATDLGYDALEPRFGAGHHGIELDAKAETLRAARELSEARGVPFCCVSTSCRYADPSDSAQNVADTLRAIDVAAAAGSPRIRVFGGRIPPGVSRTEAIDLVADSLGSVADRASARNVTVCVETHDDWCDPEHVSALMQKVNHPNIAVNWDIMHPVRVAKKSMDQAFGALRPWIRHVHVHDGVEGADGQLKLVPIGEGAIDHGRALHLLKESGYEGFISGEWIRWEPPEVHLPRELAKLKALEAAGAS